MKPKELTDIRHQLGKSQRQMANLLGVSLKAVQSFEQGWRKVPVHIERQSLFLLAMKTAKQMRSPCWAILKCPQETREKCPAWELQAGHLCWFINGTICKGKPQKSWRQKMDICRSCEVLQPLLNS